MLRKTGMWTLTFIFVTAVSLVLVSCAKTRYYTEEELGLRKETIYDEASTTPAHGETTKMAPGESKKIERAFENAPPLIPHDITGMLPLEMTDNICTTCHMPEEAEDTGATPIPRSHLVDLDTGEDLSGELDGGRFNCMQCHVIQNILDPAVENVFKGEFRDEQGRYRSNLLEKLNEGIEIE